MTYKHLIAVTRFLIKERAMAHGDEAQQKRINARLDELYALRRQMLVEGTNKGGNQ